MEANQPPVVPAPTLGFYIGLVPAERRTALLNRIAKRVAEDFDTKVEAAMQALGFEQAPPRERYDFYLTKTEAEWQEQAAKFPGDYEHDWVDFQRLKDRAASEGW